MYKKIAFIGIILILAIGLFYQNFQLKDARERAVEQYKSNIYHLETLNRLMLDEIESKDYHHDALHAFSNRTIDAGIIAYELGLPANNYYIRLETLFNEFPGSSVEDSIKEITFLLKTLEALYNLIGQELTASTNDVYKKIYQSNEIEKISSNYLSEQEKNHYQ